jgi:hypothetical protein
LDSVLSSSTSGSAPRARGRSRGDPPGSWSRAVQRGERVPELLRKARRAVDVLHRLEQAARRAALRMWFSGGKTESASVIARRVQL